jgi:hypothetical protein
VRTFPTVMVHTIESASEDDLSMELGVISEQGRGGRRLSDAEKAKTAYLEPNRDCMQKPNRDLPVLKPFLSKNNQFHAKVQSIYKGGYSVAESGYYFSIARLLSTSVLAAESVLMRFTWIV